MGFDLASAKPVGGFDISSAKPETPTPTRSAAYLDGKNNTNGSLQGLVSVVNGPLLGFGDEVLAALGTPLKAAVTGQSMGDTYRELRDGYRGMQDAQAEQNPWTTALTQTAASAPLGAIKWGATAANATKPVNILRRMLNSGTTAAGYGTVAGAGNSTAEDLSGVLEDAGKGGATGAVFGSALVPVGAAMGGAGRNAMSRFNETSAAAYAREKLAQALARDAQGSVFTSGAANPVNAIEARLGKLGDAAVVADAAGANTRQLLDTLATLPGQTKDATANMIRNRQAGRAGRLIEAADNSLGTQGNRLAPTVDALVEQRAQDSAPLYNQVRQINVTPSDTLRGIVQAADDLGALTEARTIATANQQRFGISPTNPQNWNLGQLDHIKQGLDQLIAKQWDAVQGKLTPKGASLQGLKDRLVGELDAATTNPQTGQSIYQQARNAYSGPSAMIDAANVGRRSITQDADAITANLSRMSQSEQDAFKVGAFEALRSKLGSSDAGRTQIIDMWKNPTMQEKLKAIFGDERAYRQFASTAATEGRLKLLEGAGKGSQTASRQFGAGDLDVSALADAGAAVGNAKTGNFLGALGAAKKFATSVSTPEPVRNQIGKMLLSGGQEGLDNLATIADITRQINQRQGRNALLMGTAAGQATPWFLGR